MAIFFIIGESVERVTARMKKVHRRNDEPQTRESY